MLKAKDVRFQYKKNSPILRDISFELEYGQVLCLLGPNGTGKTTLLRCILGLNKTSSGSVSIGDIDVSSLPERKKAAHMAYVSQSSKVSFPYEVRDVVMMGRVASFSPGGSAAPRDVKIVNDVMERLEIGGLARRRFQELSGGEQQMVLIARSLAQQARIIIMDEPTANLDFSNQTRILRVIRTLSDDGFAILMTSHYPDHAFLACTKVALMRDGRIVNHGAPDKIVTTQNLTQLYGIPIRVTSTDVIVNGSAIKVCVPILAY
ncbi:MAG: ABC transporter ATP-binding protein [Synergistaceae bacterium]|jgi:iron complex transport system ATP-binding protein|nr:ABC transporter ATP-binding protein [Synergistaceae bacterium]